MEERLQKIMAQAGIGSRRYCEELIAAGRVAVNGRPAELGIKVDSQRDRITVDSQPLALPETPVYIAIYKPRGTLSTVSAPDTRPTVRDLVNLPGRLYPVGRLDVDSEGLMLLTNDGDLANRLTHPRYGHEKEYRVLLACHPDDQQLETWRRGVVLPDGYRTAPARINLAQPSGKGMWLRVVLKEGRKRQIRETGAVLGLPVVKIIRVRIGSLYLDDLKPSQWRALTSAEIEELKSGNKPAGIPRRRPRPALTRQTALSRQKAPTASHDRPSALRKSTVKTPAPRPSRGVPSSDRLPSTKSSAGRLISKKTQVGVPGRSRTPASRAGSTRRAKLQHPKRGRRKP